MAGHKYILKRAGTYPALTPISTGANQHLTGDVNTASAFANPVTNLVKKRADPAFDTFTPVADLGKRSHESQEFVKLRSDGNAESLQLSASLRKRKDMQSQRRSSLLL